MNIQQPPLHNATMARSDDFPWRHTEPFADDNNFTLKKGFFVKYTVRLLNLACVIVALSQGFNLGAAEKDLEIASYAGYRIRKNWEVNISWWFH